jgi:hypothetical protein
MPVESYIDELLANPKTRFSKPFGMAGYAKRAVIAFLKDFYKDDKNTTGPNDPEGQFVYYGEDDVDSNQGKLPTNAIAIVDRYAYDQQRADPRPKLVVVRGGVSRQPRTLDGGMVRRQLLQGKVERQTVKSVSLQIVAASREGDEAERLADITFEMINAFSEKFRKLLGWEQIETLEISPESPADVDSRPDFVTVSIGVSGVVLSTFIRSRHGPTFSGTTDPNQVINNDGKPVTFT